MVFIAITARQALNQNGYSIFLVTGNTKKSDSSPNFLVKNVRLVYHDSFDSIISKLSLCN